MIHECIQPRWSDEMTDVERAHEPTNADSVGFENPEWIIDEKLVLFRCMRFDFAIFIDHTDDKDCPWPARNRFVQPDSDQWCQTCVVAFQLFFLSISIAHSFGGKFFVSSNFSDETQLFHLVQLKFNGKNAADKWKMIWESTGVDAAVQWIHFFSLSHHCVFARTRMYIIYIYSSMGTTAPAPHRWTIHMCVSRYISQYRRLHYGNIH